MTTDPELARDSSAEDRSAPQTDAGKAGETRSSSEAKHHSGGSGVQLVTVDAAHEGQRIDNFLMRELKGVPRTHVYRIIRRGDVRIDKKRCKPERKLVRGEVVRIPPFSGADVQAPGKLSDTLKARLLGLVLLETEDFVVLNKPSGLAVHGGSGIRLGLIEAVRQVSPNWAQAELAHRLDRETSGCLLIAKNARFLKFAQDQFRVKTVKKEYLALVHGEWPQAISSVNARLLKDAVSETERIVRAREEGKEALTRFVVEQRFSAVATLIRALPETGRTHQIRVHCQVAGHTIMGDDKYTPREVAQSAPKVSSLCLHAERLAFLASPERGTIEVVAELDSQFAELLTRLQNR